jgi:23S rRNA (uridine2552-2'-O)-methyltransferase
MKEVQDHYFRLAKKEGYPARSVYKLKEAQEKFRFLKPVQHVLDLGASPGSWSKYLSRVLGPGGRVVAIDLNPLKVSAPNIEFIRGDIFELAPAMLLGDERGSSGRFHAVLSDMAPKTTGRKDLDHYRSMDLARQAAEIARRVLRHDGTFYCKVFEGEDLPEFRRWLSTIFRSVRLFKPKSSRSESVEIFLFCSGLKPEAPEE